jgi:carboxyl-terminal processing protease
MRTLLLLVAVVLSSFSGLAFAADKSQAADDSDLQCKYLYAIEQGFLAQHVKYSPKDRDAALQTRVIEQYLKRLDPTKIYLLQSDVEGAKKALANIFENTKVKDCSALVAVQNILVSRVKERAEFAKKMLDKSYKFDNKVEIVFDPDKKEFPKTNEEANDFLRRYVHFQISNYLATDMKLEEAKSNVIKNWERAVKRTVETKDDDIYAGYLDSFARGLDPHSSFFSKDVLEDFEIQMSLSLEGIGATLSQQDGFTVVEALVPGGSAARSGQLKPQDKIIAVGQGEKGVAENVVEQDLRDVVRKIRGEKGTKVKLTILRKEGEGKKRFDVLLVRDKIKLEDEAASILYQDKEVNGVKKKMGIINFPSFYADSRRGGRSSAADLKKLIAEARAKKVDGLVLDLSNNGGGSLEDAVKIAGLFFQTGAVVKQSAREEGKGELVYRDQDSQVDWAGPLVVLTSRISASASEIVAGTLQDYKRAVVVGNDHTFGKGSVQSVLPIPQNLGALKVTVGMFFTPGGYSTQHRGVNSDIQIPGPYVVDDIGEKFLDYSLPEKKLDSFVSEDAFVKEGTGTWLTINPEWIKTLAEKSKTRVDKDPEFKKILDDLEKNKAKGKAIKLTEVTKDKEKKEKAKAAKNASKNEKDKEYLKRADIQEASNVLADLIAVEASNSVAAVKN